MRDEAEDVEGGELDDEAVFAWRDADAFGFILRPGNPLLYQSTSASDALEYG